MRTRASTAALALLLLMLAPAAVRAGDDPGGCREMRFEGRDYALCEAPAGAELRLWLRGPDGTPIGSFDRLAAAIGPEKTLVFAMNAGMYHADRSPVGLYVEAGRELAPLVTAAGPGNFGMQPNGVFCIGTTGFAIIETRAFAVQPRDCTYATQSGPMLVIGGALHPRFLPESASRHVRNGVGVSADGRRAYLALSAAPVTFHEFARLFRDGLGLGDALYLDGSISRLYAPALGRNDIGLPLGPIVGLVTPRPGPAGAPDPAPGG